jgi:Ca-activated chloride channel family protein
MNLARPYMLVLLVLPVVLGLLLVRPKKQKKDVLRFSDAGLLRELKINPLPAWRRRLPLSGLVFGLVMMVLASAEPQVEGPIKSSSSTVVLALDVSRSMLAEDVSPNRYEAAKKAALDFIRSTPDEVKIGVVAFAGRTEILAVPGSSREDLERAVESIELEGGTAIGEAIFTSLSLLDTQGWGADPEDPTKSVQKRTGAIVLMSDGATNVGRTDKDAALAAALASVPVYTVAFGTETGVIVGPDGTLPVPAAPGPLQEISSTTQGESYEAKTGDQLSKIFKNLAKTVAVEQGWISISHWIALFAALILFATALAWIRFGARI